MLCLTADRCHYAALTGTIRALLRQYEQRPPPLAPLAAALRTLTPLCDDLEAPSSTCRSAYSDLSWLRVQERLTATQSVFELSMVSGGQLTHKTMHVHQPTWHVPAPWWQHRW